MKTEVSWTFLGLIAVWLAAGVALFAWPDQASIATFAFVLIGWIVSLCLHEYAHAATASAFGDTTIIERGYLTLNPLHYFRGGGSLILPVIAVIFGGIALPGGAVLIRNDLIRRPWQQSLVALAGPLTTLACAVVCYVAARAVTGDGGGGSDLLADALILLTFFELMAFVLNILPLPGLDGFAALRPFLPQVLTRAIPPQVGNIVSSVMLLAVFFFGYRILTPILHVITDLSGIDLSPVGRAFARFHFW